jgi:hypothetical protein
MGGRKALSFLVTAEGNMRCEAAKGHDDEE